MLEKDINNIKLKVNLEAIKFLKNKNNEHIHEIWNMIGEYIAKSLYKRFVGYIYETYTEYEDICSMVYIWINESLIKYNPECNNNFMSHCYWYCYWKCSDYFRSFLTNSKKILNKNTMTNYSDYENDINYIEAKHKTEDFAETYSNSVVKETILNVLLSIFKKYRSSFDNLENGIIDMKLDGKTEKEISDLQGLDPKFIRNKSICIKRKLKTFLKKEKVNLKKMYS